MAIEVTVPSMGESIYEVQIVRWLRQTGQWVDKDQPIVEIESEKATVELPSPAAGVLTAIRKNDGEFASVGEVIAEIDSAGSPGRADVDAAIGAAAAGGEPAATALPVSREPAPVEPREPAGGNGKQRHPPARVMPSAQRALDEYGLLAEEVEATGPGGRLLKEDVLRHAEQRGLAPRREEPAAEEPPRAEAAPRGAEQTPVAAADRREADRQEEVVPMSMIRLSIARRLVEAQQQAALVTTFNEAEMTAVIALRAKHREEFQKKYGVKLGFMPFFVKAAIEALKRFPQVNAEIRGRNVAYRNYYDIGIAIGGGKGLVVPVLRNAERMSFADIERVIDDLARRAAESKLKPEELEGGTFTITNGGIYGSLLSTPIVNPPQSGILGLHAIQERPVAREGQVVIRPMMYLALTYDHRIVDGREGVGFLKTVKELIEDPARLLLEI